MMKNRFGKPFYPGKPNRTYALIGGAVFLYMIFVTGFRKSPDCTTQASAGGGEKTREIIEIQLQSYT